MEATILTTLIEAVAPGGIFAVLFVILLWVGGRQWLKERERDRQLYRDSLETITNHNHEDTKRLSEVVDRNSRVMLAHSRACLIKTMSDSGSTAEDAILAAERLINGRP